MKKRLIIYGTGDYARTLALSLKDNYAHYEVIAVIGDASVIRRIITGE